MTCPTPDSARRIRNRRIMRINGRSTQPGIHGRNHPDFPMSNNPYAPPKSDLGVQPDPGGTFRTPSVGHWLRTGAIYGVSIGLISIDLGKDPWWKGLLACLGYGVLCAIAISLYMRWWTKWKMRTFAVERRLRSGERTIAHGLGNRRGAGLLWKTGYLWLTDRRLCHLVRRTSGEEEVVEVPLEEITGARRCWVMWLSRSGVAISTTKGGEVRLLVNDPAAWVADIERARADLQAK